MTLTKRDDGGRLSLTERPVQVAVGGDDEEGCLIFAMTGWLPLWSVCPACMRSWQADGILRRGLAGWRAHTSPRSGISADADATSKSRQHIVQR
jgi:hypothetical protein